LRGIRERGGYAVEAGRRPGGLRRRSPGEPGKPQGQNQGVEPDDRDRKNDYGPGLYGYGAVAPFTAGFRGLVSFSVQVSELLLKV
jgi:hypothetical protein